MERWSNSDVNPVSYAGDLCKDWMTRKDQSDLHVFVLGDDQVFQQVFPSDVSIQGTSKPELDSHRISV